MGLWTAFHRSRFHPIGALPHTVGGYRLQQRVKQRDHDSTLSEDQRGGKAVDGLQSTCEAELTGAQSLAQGCPYHDRADQIIGQHIHPQFLPHHRRGAASQHVHAKSHLDRSQVELALPDATYKNDLVSPQVLASGAEQPEGSTQKGERTACPPL